MLKFVFTDRLNLVLQIELWSAGEVLNLLESTQRMRHSGLSRGAINGANETDAHSNDQRGHDDCDQAEVH